TYTTLCAHSPVAESADSHSRRPPFASFCVTARHGRRCGDVHERGVSGSTRVPSGRREQRGRPGTVLPATRQVPLLLVYAVADDERGIPPRDNAGPQRQTRSSRAQTRPG